MLINLLNYKSDLVLIDMPDLDKYDNILVTIAIVYGDEYIAVTNGDNVIFGAASDHAKWRGGFDGEYVVYERNGKNQEPEIDWLHNPEWINRKDSYEFLYRAIDEFVERNHLMD